MNSSAASCVLQPTGKTLRDIHHVEIGQTVLGAIVNDVADELHALGRVVLLNIGEDGAQGLAVRTGGEHEGNGDHFAAKRAQQELLAILHVENKLGRLTRHRRRFWSGVAAAINHTR